MIIIRILDEFIILRNVAHIGPHKTRHGTYKILVEFNNKGIMEIGAYETRVEAVKVIESVFNSAQTLGPPRRK